MKAFGTRMRGGIAAALSAALIMGGALLAAPAAYAEEPVAEVVATDAPAIEVPAAEAPTEEAPAEEPAVAPAADAPAEAAPATEAAPAETAAQAPVTVTPQAVAAAPALVSTEAPRAGGEITVTGSGFAAAYPGVYIGIAPAGYTGFYAGASGLLDTVHVATTNEEGTSSSGRTAKMNDDGSFSVTFTVPAFEESKPYSLYVSKAHGQGMADTSQNVIADIAYEAPAPTTEGTATVIAADASGITVRGALTNVNATANPNGVHFGVVPRGTAIGSTSSDFLGATASVTSIPSDGSISADVVIPAAQLDATQEYELVVWPRRTNPTAENVVKVLEFDVTAEQWAAVFPAPVPALTADVTETAGTGISVAVAGSGFDDVRALPGQPSPSVYVALVEKGGSLALEQSDAIAVNIAEGKFTGTVTAASAKLDRTKSYELISWPSRSNPSESNILARTDAVVDWDALFPAPVVEGNATVIAADASGITVRGALTNVNATANPNGVHVGVVPRGTAIGSTSSDFLGATASVTSIPSDGSISADVVIPAAQLDATQEYELVVWPRRTNPTAENVVKVLEFDVTAEQWAAVFPAPVPAGVVSVTAASEAGLTLSAALTGLDAAGLPNGVYVGLIEAGTAETATTSSIIGTQWVRSIAASGEVTQEVTALQASLDRTKSYEVLVWRGHTNPSAATNVLVLPVAVTAAQWDAVFPPAAPVPALTADVTETAGTGISVAVAGSGFDDVRALPGQPSPSVYVALVEKGGSLALEQSDAIAVNIAEGKFTGTVTAASAKLDRTKSYELISWPSRSNPSESNILARTDAVVDWDALFPPVVPTPAGVVSVTAASEAGLTLSAALTGLDAAGLPNGVYVGLIEAGTAETATTSSIIGTQWVRSIAASGEVTQEVTALQASLDRTKSYEVLVWRGHTNPSAATNVLVLPVAVTAAQWDAVFPPVIPTGPSITADVTENAETSIDVAVSGTGFEDVKALPGQTSPHVYVALVEKNGGFALEQSDAISADVVDGKISGSLTVLAAKLDRTKQYEVITWPSRSNPSEENIYARTDAVIDWDALFPAVPGAPAITASITENAGVSIDARVAGTGFEDVKALPGQTSPHVYVALVEKNGGFALEQSDAISAEVIDGKISGTLTVLAAKLDRTKQYEVITWPSRSNPSEENIYARTDAVINWNKLFPTPPAEGTAIVVAASTAGITVRGSLTKVNAAANPNGVHVGVVARGTAIGATSGSFLGETVSIAAVPANGSITADVKIPKAQLDPSKQYELVVWPQLTNPTASNVVKVLTFDVSAAQWSAVFPPAVTTPGAGSLTWGVSTEFNDYIMGTIAKGKVSPSGVGGGRGGYVFPQATSSSWNAATRTGSVQYRGSVNYWGHGGLIDMTFANPVITVTSPISGTISSGGQTFSLNLGSAGFTQNADGSVTFSNVGVNGSISGGDGGGSGGTVSMDSLSFTVGSVSGLNFGSSSTTSPFAQTRTAAATPPSTTGLTVVTAADKLVAGGEIEITASGFQPNEQGILVVLYSDPTVLDTNAKADENGVVRWIGKLPKDISGKHTITLQGSINVGHEITIAKADAEKKFKSAVASQSSTTEAAQSNGGALSQSGTPAWVWWAGALALLVVAGASTGLVVAQRRKSDAPTHL